MKSLTRYPVVKNDLLQAWDASDELVISHLNTLDLKAKKILILNDSFGALSSHLLDLDLCVYTDSYVSYKAINQNTKDSIDVVYDLTAIEGKFDIAILKLPKNLSFLEDQLITLKKLLHKDSSIIYSSMIKHLSKGVFPLIEKYHGDVTTSLAKKKARLLFSKSIPKFIDSPYPFNASLDGFDKEFTFHSNLFSRGKLDVGTRFFLEHLPSSMFKNILDLGCANGIVGIKSKQLNPNANITFCDDSFMAIKSAKQNYSKFFKDESKLKWINCYEGDEKNLFDLILCNPPFHQNNTVGDFIALQMFKDAKRVLRKDGKIYVIGNTHLAYPSKLKKLFGNNCVVSKNEKFLISFSVKQ